MNPDQFAKTRHRRQVKMVEQLSTLSAPEPIRSGKVYQLRTGGRVTFSSNLETTVKRASSDD
jgi:hypothetical protein